MIAKKVKQSTSLTFAEYNYSVHEKRIVYAVIHSLQSKLIFFKNQKNIEKLNEICKEDYFVTLNKKQIIPTGYQNYKVIKDAITSLLKNIVVFPDFETREKIIFTGIIQEAEMSRKSSTIKLKISKKILPLLVMLAHGYTEYALDSAFNCTSSYSMRFYEFVNQWRSEWKKHPKKYLNLKLIDIKNFLCLKDKYSKSNEFKKFILKPAAKELKEKADIWFEIKEPIKEGRKVVGWKISIHERQESKKYNQALPKAPSPEDQKILDRLVNIFHLSEGQARKVVAKSDPTKLEQELEKILMRIKKGELKNVGGYSFKVLAEQFDINIGKKTPSKKLPGARKSFESAKSNSPKPSEAKEKAPSPKDLENGFTKFLKLVKKEEEGIKENPKPQENDGFFV